MRFLISYDLDVPGQQYPKLITELQRLGARRVLYSQWIARLTNTAAEIRNHLKGFIDTNDRLLVSSLDSADWASYNLMTDPNTV